MSFETLTKSFEALTKSFKAHHVKIWSFTWTYLSFKSLVQRSKYFEHAHIFFKNLNFFQAS